MLNLIFDPCFKVKCGHHTKTSLFLPYYWCCGFRFRQTMKSKGSGREIVNAFHTYVCLCICLCIRLCVRWSGFNINLNISFNYKDIFIKFTGNVLWLQKPVSANFWPHFDKQNGHHSQLFKNHKVVLNLEIIQLASSNLHKRYMARKASLIVILTKF